MVLRKLSQSFKISLALMFSVLSSGLLQVAPVYAGNHDNGSSDNINICHATGSESNPYITNSPAKSGDVAGHDGHHGEGEDVVWYPGAKDDGISWDDIIPEFTYTDENDVVQTYLGKNWSTEGLIIYNNDCNTTTTSLNIEASPCVSNEVDDGSISVAISGSFDNGSKVVLKQGVTQLDISGPINDDDDLPVVFSDLSSGTYVVSLEKGNTVYATATVTLDECSDTPTPATPTFVAAAQPCEEGDITQDVTVEVTNVADDTDESVTYTVTVGVETETITDLADGASQTVTFPGLTAGDYTVTVTGDDETEAVDGTVTVAACETPRVPTVCTVSNQTFIQPWTYGGETYPATDGSTGSYTFKTDGLYLNTPDIESTVYGLTSAGNTPIVDVDAMSYKTLRLAESAGYEYTAPAYILEVDTNGLSVAGGVKYFFYEPYNNSPPLVQEGIWQTWDAINSGDAIWWMSGTGQALHAWDYFVTTYPEAVVTSYGFNQGTYNAQTFAAVQDITFDCATTHFSAPGQGGGGEVFGDQTGGGQMLSTATSAALPAMIPSTGAKDSPFMIIIASLLAYGAAYFLQGRRMFGRKESLEA